MAPSLTIFIVPILLVLFLAEMIYSYIDNRHVYHQKDTLSNIVVGLGFLASNALSKVIMFFVFQWAYQHKLFELGNNIIVWILAFLGADLSYYIFHRVSHEVSWFWAAHVVHHSSEEYNYSVAFRLTWVSHFTGHFVFWIWMPFLGFSPFMVLAAMQVGMLYQGLLHTKLVGKLHPIIEFFFNTPSHHRVHHSSNLEYLDKNHGAMFITWDRLFGSFTEERSTLKYGLTTGLTTKGPLKIVFHEWQDMFKRVKNAGNIKNAIHYLIKSPGWSPDGSTLTVKQMRKEGK